MGSKDRSRHTESTLSAPGAAKLSRPFLVALALGLITAAVYFPTAWHGFVDYDDADYVNANSHVLSGVTWANIKWAFTSGQASNWHPLTWISHMLDCWFFGPKPGPMHLVSVGFHVTNAILLLFVLRAMTGRLWPSAVVAALFALHPLRVESVAWISERKDVLSTFFLLLTLRAYVEYVANTRQSSSPGNQRRGWGFYLLAVAAIVLGLMSKPMLVTLPFLLVLLDYWPLQRFGEGANDFRRAVPGLLVEKAPFFLLCLVSSVVTYRVQQEGGAVSASVTLSQRLANAVVAYARYLGKTFWPVDLSVLYLHPGSWPWWRVTISGAIVLVLLGLALWQWRRRPYLVVGLLWFLGMLVPVIGLVQVGLQSMADRYTYVPVVGLFIGVVWLMGDLGPRLGWGDRHLSVVASLVVGVCGVFTVRQVRTWHDTDTLFSQAVLVDTRNYLAYNNRGFYRSRQGKSDEAMEDYRKSLEINPNYEDALNNMGYALAGKKRHAEALGYYEAALRVKPLHVEVHNNLGNALSELGRIDESIIHYRFVLERKPDHADAHNNLGIALAMQGKLDEAVEHFRLAIRYKPDYASAHSNLGNAFAVQHKLDEATQEYQECLRLNPNDPQAHNNLGNVLAEQGNLAEAVAQYERALQLNATNPEAQFNLGMALERSGKRNEALPHYTEALRLKPDYEAARRQLETPLPTR